MRKGLTAADRLGLLLPWLNIDPLAEERQAERDADYRPRFPPKEVRHRLRRFVAAFDGDTESGWVRVGKVEWRPGAWRTPFRIPAVPKAEQSDSEEMVHEWLRLILRHWLLTSSRSVPMPTLKFGVEGDSGVYTLNVEGAFPDVVLYLVASLLATSTVEVKRCAAPAPSEPGKPNDWLTTCDNFFVSKGVGRPALFCSDACRSRNYAKEHPQKPKSKRRTR